MLKLVLISSLLSVFVFRCGGSTDAADKDDPYACAYYKMEQIDTVQKRLFIDSVTPPLYVPAFDTSECDTTDTLITCLKGTEYLFIFPDSNISTLEYYRSDSSLHAVVREYTIDSTLYNTTKFPSTDTLRQGDSLYRVEWPLDSIFGARYISRRNRIDSLPDHIDTTLYFGVYENEGDLLKYYVQDPGEERKLKMVVIRFWKSSIYCAK